jgi:hypothetical protein
MSLPGFTAEAGVFRSSRQYRPKSSSRGDVKGVAPQMQSSETCMDWECLSSQTGQLTPNLELNSKIQTSAGS